MVYTNKQGLVNKWFKMSLEMNETILGESKRRGITQQAFFEEIFAEYFKRRKIKIGQTGGIKGKGWVDE